MARNDQRKPLVDESIPRYALTEKAYIDDVLYDPDSPDPRFHEISYTGIPGPHMDPLNDAAVAMKEKHAARQIAIDPILEMTNMRTGAASEQMSDLAMAIAQALGAAMSKQVAA